MGESGIEPDSDSAFEMTLCFFIDGEAYTDRDREMFCVGFEFCSIVKWLDDPDRRMEYGPVRPDNQERVLVAASNRNVIVSFEDSGEPIEPGSNKGNWLHLDDQEAED